MNKILHIGALLLALFALSFSAQARDCLSETPLPPDIPTVITSTMPDTSDGWVPGVYTGTWPSIDACQTLVIRSVEGRKVKLVYAYGPGDYPASFEEHTVKMKRDGVISFDTAWGATITYHLDGTSTYKHFKVTGTGEVSPTVHETYVGL